MVRTLLDSLRLSTIILGDVNTRFRDPLHQAGWPGPVDRLQVFDDFLTQTRFRHVKPDASLQKLTTDHVFTQTQQSLTLDLLSNTQLAIPTDHKYTLVVTLGQGKPGRGPPSDLKRFRISRLAKPDQRQALLDLVNGSKRPFRKDDDVNVINTQLVAFCQRVQEQTIGLATPRPGGARHSPTPPTRPQTLQASIRLYKHASQASRENDVIFPTQEAADHGLDAMAENLAILQERWQGQPFQAPAIELAPEEIKLWSREDVAQEIREQEAEKSCGTDGLHIRFLKAVEETSVLIWL